MESSRRDGSFVVEDMIEIRHQFTETIAITMIAALGIILISQTLISRLSPYMVLAVGIGLCVLSLYYVFSLKLRSRIKTANYDAFVVYDASQNRTVRVPAYEFSEHLERSLSAVFQENSALKQLWKREPLSRVLFPSRQTFTHLTDYFNEDRFSAEYLKKYERSDIPDILLRNRFLETFSRPMNERSAFADRHFDEA